MNSREAVPGRYTSLEKLVGDASRALARLDADRLEELALSCRALNRDATPLDRQTLAQQSHAVKEEMAVFARVIQGTHANLEVMNRLREFRAGRLEYGGFQVSGSVQTRVINGND